MTTKPHKRLFLTASFADVAVGFDKFLPDCQGKTLAFIPTACDVEAYTKFMDDDRQAFMDLGMVVDELDLSAMDFDTLCQKITNSDCVFVGGGNTFYLLSMLKHTGLDKLIIQAINDGKPYVGTSAGSIITAFDIEYVAQMDDKQKAPLLTDTAGLGVVDFYVLPHFDNPPFVQVAHKIYDQYRTELALTPISNHQAVMVIDDTIQLCSF